jgi:hypothetical protein
MANYFQIQIFQKSKFISKFNLEFIFLKFEDITAPMSITSIDDPLILVKDKSNIREASRVTLEGLQWEKQGSKEYPYRSRKRMRMRLGERVLGVGKWFPKLCT